MTTIISELAAIGSSALELLSTFWIFFLAGILVGAFIRTFRFHVTIRRALGRFGHWAIPVAAVTGVASPLCSCGTIPIFISLVSSGVPLSTAMALLIAAPLMSPAGYTVTAWELGHTWAIAETAAGIGMGLLAGYLTLFLEKRYFPIPGILTGPIVPDIHAPDCPGDLKCTCNLKFSNRLAAQNKPIPYIFGAKAWELAVVVGKFTLMGVLIQAVAARYIPSQWIQNLMGSGHPLEILGVTLASIPLPVNQITAAATLYGFINLGVAKGAGFAFLIGGPVTSFPAISMLAGMFKPRVVVLYLAASLAGTILFANLFQLLAP